MTHTAIEVPAKTVSEVLNAAVSFSAKLADGEKLTGTPAVVEVTTTDLVLASKIVSTSIHYVSGVLVPIGEAVLFSVAGGVTGQLYTVNVSCDTDAIPPQTLHGKVTFNVEDD